MRGPMPVSSSSGAAGLDQLGHPFLVALQRLVERGDAPGKTDGFLTGGRGRKVLVAGPPPGDLADLCWRQRFAGIETEVGRPQ